MSEPALLVECADAIATLTLNRPSTRNSLNQELIESLLEAVPRVAADTSIRVVVLTGAGGAFCSGADLKSGLSEPGSGSVSAMLDALHKVVRAMVQAPKPFVAAIDGAAVGFGCDLALGCDLRVLSSRAYLREIFVNIGLMPDGGGTYWLPRLVGLGRALEYMMLGRRIDAALASEVGLANRVVDVESFQSEVRTLAGELAAAPPLALASIKRAVSANACATLDQALAREKAYQLELLASADVMEGVMAWAQNRRPVFQGR